jgi:hypothetical protein
MRMGEGERSDQIKRQSALLDRFDEDEEEKGKAGNRRGGAAGGIIISVEQRVWPGILLQCKSVSLSLSSCWVTKSTIALGENGERGTGPKKAQLFRLQTSEQALLTHFLLNPLSRPKKTRTVSSWTKGEKKKEIGKKTRSPKQKEKKVESWPPTYPLDLGCFNKSQ